MNVREWLRPATALPILAIIAALLALIAFDLASSGDASPSGDEVATPLPTNTPGPTPTPGPSPTPTPTPTPDPEAAIRDERRRTDLAALANALGAYYRRYGSFPTTGGNIQTLCVYRDNDQGCKLAEFLDPLPIDPRGDPNTYGYWYQSDGVSFMLYASMETSAAGAQCPARPPAFLREVALLYCLPGGPP